MIKFGELNLWVSDVEKAAQFYAAIFETEIAERGDGWCKVKHNNISLTFFKAKSADKGLKMGECAMMTGDITTDEFDAMLERVKSVGGEVAEMLEWDQGRHTFFRDLDGITWELIEVS